MSLTSSPGHNIDFCLLHHQGLIWQCQACLLSNGTFASQTGHYIALTNKFAKTLLPPDSLDVDAAYQDFCNTIKKAAKKTTPRGYRNNYIPCWDAERESLYKTFLQSPQGDDSSLALLAKLDRNGGIDGPRQFGALTSHTQVQGFSTYGPWPSSGPQWFFSGPWSINQNESNMLYMYN